MKFTPPYPPPPQPYPSQRSPFTIINQYNQPVFPKQYIPFSYAENRSPYRNTDYLFSNIRQFLNFNPICPSCNRNIIPCFRINESTNIYPNDEEEKYDNIHLPIIGDNLYRTYTQYKSKLENNILSLDEFSNYGKTFINKHFAIDIDSNENSIELEYFKKVTQSKTVKIIACCFNRDCIKDCSYYFISDKLYVDSKNNKLYGTRLSGQCICVFVDDLYYVLSTSDKDDKTSLMSKKSFTHKPKLINKYPFIDFRKLSSIQAIQQKIKTLLMFG